MLLNWQPAILHSNENCLEYIKEHRKCAFVDNALNLPPCLAMALLMINVTNADSFLLSIDKIHAMLKQFNSPVQLQKTD